MAAHQAPLSLGFSRQEYWSGLPLLSPMHAKSLQLCPTLCDPMDSSPPGSSVHRILQARKLEWVAISFSTANMKALQIVLLRGPLDLGVHPGSSPFGQHSQNQDFPGAPVVKTLPANARNTGLTPGGRSHYQEQLSLSTTTTEARVPRDHTLQ